MATSSSQKNFQRSNTVVDSCKGLDTCWSDVPMDMFLLPQTANPYIQQYILNDLELVDLQTEHQDFSDWPVSNILQSSSFSNYAVGGYYPMSYPAPATPTPISTIENFHQLAYSAQYMSADTNCMSYSDLSYNNVSSNNFDFNKSDNTNDSDSDSDATAFTLTPNSPIPEMMDTKPKPKSKSKSKSRVRKPKEPKPLKTFVCRVGDCMKVFSRQFNLDQHSKTHSNDRPFVCEREDCKKAFIRRADLVRHGRTHTGETPFKCKFQDCNEMFSRTEARQRHYAKAHQGLHQKSL
ncbi:hypothetical protein BGX21_005013, partial [Mortierella sp. AD011]